MMMVVFDTVFNIVIDMFSEGFCDGQSCRLAIFLVEQLTQPGPRQLRSGRKAEDASGGFGEGDYVRFSIPGPIAESRCAQGEFQAFRSFVESAACLFMFADVTSDLRSADDASIRPFDRRDCQRNVEQPAVFSHAYGFVVLDANAGAESRQDRRLFVEMTFRDQHRDGLADYFISGVAEDALRSGVPARNDALERLADDCVIRGFDQGRKPVWRELGTLEI